MYQLPSLTWESQLGVNFPKLFVRKIGQKYDQGIGMQVQTVDCKNIHIGSDLRLIQFRIGPVCQPPAKMLRREHKEQGQVLSNAGIYQQRAVLVKAETS